MAAEAPNTLTRVSVPVLVLVTVALQRFQVFRYIKNKNITEGSQARVWEWRRWWAATRGSGGDFRFSHCTWLRLHPLSSTLSAESHFLDVDLLLWPERNSHWGKTQMTYLSFNKKPQQDEHRPSMFQTLASSFIVKMMKNVLQPLAEGGWIQKLLALDADWLWLLAWELSFWTRVQEPQSLCGVVQERRQVPHEISGTGGWNEVWRDWWYFLTLTVPRRFRFSLSPFEKDSLSSHVQKYHRTSRNCGRVRWSCDVHPLKKLYYRY